MTRALLVAVTCLCMNILFINNTNAVSVKDFGAIENDSIDDSEKIQNAINYISSIGGGVVEFPVGNFLLENTIFMENNVDLIGAGINKTRLSYTGSTLAINANGTSNNIKVFKIESITIDGANSTENAEGIQFAQNHRSRPLMRDSSIINFPHYGIHFTDNNWLLSFEDIVVTGNGHNTVNSAGIYKNPSITDLVDVRFTGMTIEKNGSASSVAGGVNLQTISPDVSKGITFRNSTIEGNFGSLDVYVDGSDHFVIDDVYIESTGNTSGTELKKCIGIIKNSRISSDPGNTGKAVFINTINLATKKIGYAA